MGVATLMTAAAAALGGQLPDIEIDARVKAKQVTIERQGRASARVRLEPNGADRVEVERNLPPGQTTYRNLDLRLKVEGRLADLADRETNQAATAQEKQGN